MASHALTLISRFVRRRAAAAATILAVLLLAGCFGNRREVASTDSRRSIAAVNNEQITLDEFQEAYRKALESWERFVVNDSTKRAELGRIELERMIEAKLLDQEARRRGIKVDEDAFRAALQSAVSPGEPARLAETVEQEGASAKNWVRSMRRRAMHEKLIEQEVAAKIHISARDIRTYYQEHKDKFVQPEQVRVRHICVASRAVYDRVARQIERKVDFVKLVQEFSITPDRAQDGDLGYVERGVMPEEFDKAIFRMTEIGGINPLNRPVQTEMGYHIFRLEGRKAAGRLSFEDATPQIRQILLDETRPKAYAKWLQELRNRATIKIDYKLLTQETG